MGQQGAGGGAAAVVVMPGGDDEAKVEDKDDPWAAAKLELGKAEADTSALEEEIRKTFDLYDTSKDGLLSREEFIAALSLRTRGENADKSIDSAQLIREANRIYDETDTDKNGSLDFDEFSRGYVKIEHFLSDANKGGRMAEKATHVAKKLPGGAAVEVVENIAKANAGVISDFHQPSTDKEMLIPGKKQEAGNPCAGMIVICLVCVPITLLLVLQVAPLILLAIGWSSGESCDQPLDLFCKM